MGAEGFMNQVFVAEGSKYKYYFTRPEPVFATQPDGVGKDTLVFDC